MSSFTFTARPRGRPPIHVLNVEPSSLPTEHTDIGFYPSSDGRRVALDAPSPPRKKRRVQPSDLEDDYAYWGPGDCGEDSAEENEIDGEIDGPSAVISNLEPLATRQRYLSSVSVDNISLLI